MIKEFREENKAQIVVPRCACGSVMIREYIKAKTGDSNTTRKKKGREVLDPLTFSPNMTLMNLRFKCRRHPLYMSLPMEEIIKLNEYPLRNIEFVDDKGNEI